MNAMIRTASVIALVTFWLAAIGWTVLIVAAPANAAPSNEHAGSTSTSAPAGGADKAPSVKPQPDVPPAEQPEKPAEPPREPAACCGDAAAARTLGTSTTSGMTSPSGPDDVIRSDTTWASILARTTGPTSMVGSAPTSLDDGNIVLNPGWLAPGTG